MLTSHVDGQGYVEKHFLGCVALKLKQKTKFQPATLRMFEQRETSKLKLLLTDNGCAYSGACKCLFFDVSVVLCLPSILQYSISSKRIIVREVL